MSKDINLVSAISHIATKSEKYFRSKFRTFIWRCEGSLFFKEKIHNCRNTWSLTKTYYPMMNLLQGDNLLIDPFDNLFNRRQPQNSSREEKRCHSAKRPTGSGEITKSLNVKEIQLNLLSKQNQSSRLSKWLKQNSRYFDSQIFWIDFANSLLKTRSLWKLSLLKTRSLERFCQLPV